MNGQRSEIRVRMALGARPRDIIGLVLRQVSAMTAGGLGVGLLLSFLLVQLLSGILYGVSAHDPMIFLAVPVFLAVVALAACAAPARRAARIDPWLALRTD